MSDTFEMARLAWVNDEGDLEALIGAIETAPVIVYDLETTGLDEHAWTDGPKNGGVAARLSLATFTIPRYDEFGQVEGEPTNYIVPLHHQESPWLGKWKAVIRRLATAMNGKRLVGQNVKFDHRWIYAMTGVDLSASTWWDTRISSHLLDETRSTSLKERAPETFHVERWDDFDLSFPGASETIPLFKLGEYGARDTYWTWRLYENHRERMFPEDAPMHTEEIEEARLGLLARWAAMPTTATLTAIEQRGMALDTEWVRSEIRRMEDVQETTRMDLVSRYVDDELDPSKPSFAATSHWFIRWTELAVENGDLRVAALTPTGKPQWSKQVLGRQARNGSVVARTLLDHREATKKLEYLRAWIEMVTREGRIHTTYNQGSVSTGRLSSSGPNMQQVTKKLRPAFIPTEGYYIADLDYSQIELRVAAFISGSDPMMSAYINGEDLHTIMASRISGKRTSEVTPEERQAGKAANFGLLYGMGPFGFKAYAEDAYGVVFTEQEAAQVHETFFETWNGIRQWHARSVTRLHETGQVVSPIGRVRRLPDVWDGNEARVGFAERAAINSPVQGFASDIMQIAAAGIEGNIPGIDAVRGARLVGTVHDSIVVEVPKQNWQSVTQACKHVMENEVPKVLLRMGCEFDIPLQADATVGTRWSLDDVGTM